MISKYHVVLLADLSRQRSEGLIHEVRLLVERSVAHERPVVNLGVRVLFRSLSLG